MSVSQVARTRGQTTLHKFLNTGKTPFEMMFGHLPLLPIQLKTRPYCVEHTDGDAHFINGPKLTQAEILECLMSIRDQLDEVHETAAKNISYEQAKQAKFMMLTLSGSS